MCSPCREVVRDGLVGPHRVLELHRLGHVLGLGDFKENAAFVTDANLLAVGRLRRDEHARLAWAARRVADPGSPEPEFSSPHASRALEVMSGSISLNEE